MKKEYKEIKGTIIENKCNGLDNLNDIVVSYTVNDKEYTVKEKLIMKKKNTVKLGFIPIGYTTISKIELQSGIKAIVGNEVKVKYNINNPSEAFIVDNTGKWSL